MRILILLITFTFFNEAAVAQTWIRTYYDSLNTVLKEEYQIIGDDSNNVHGPYIKFYQNGSPAVTGQFEHGTKLGEFHEFYPDSTLLRVTNFENGRKQGPLLAYASNGTLVQEAYFNKDTLQGSLVTSFQ